MDTIAQIAENVKAGSDRKVSIHIASQLHDWQQKKNQLNI